MNKQEIREQVKDLKRKLSKAEIDEYSALAVNELLNSKEYHNCSRIFTYVNFNQEIVTTELVESALKAGKKVCVPKVLGEEIKFYYIYGLEKLELSSFAIQEPVSKEEAVPDDTLNLMIVPGLAFDKNGNRIGYGKGYYDRYFKKYDRSKLVKIALAYDFQVFDQLPVQEHDVKIEQIMTPARRIYI